LKTKQQKSEFDFEVGSVADGGVGEERKGNGGNLWPMADTAKKKHKDDKRKR
jgi:hypothetical protein